MKNVEILKKSFLVGIPYLFLGSMFGVMFKAQGGSVIESVLLATFSFAGAAQFASIEFYSDSSNLVSLATILIIINLRHIYYVALSVKMYGTSKITKNYLVATTTDENFAMLSLNKKNFTGPRDILKVFSLNHAYWIIGCGLGSYANLSLKELRGVDFFLTAMFSLMCFDGIRGVFRAR